MSSACKKCQILQERLKQVESELRAAKQGARTSGHEQQLVEAPREQDLLMNLEQQVYEDPLQQIGDQDMLTQLELHHQQQQQSMDLWIGNRRSDGAGHSNHRQKQHQQQQSMDLSMYNRSSDGAAPPSNRQQQHPQQQSMDLLRYNRSSNGAGPSNHRQQQHQQQSMELSRYNRSSDGAGPSNQYEQELYEALQQESLKNDILKKLKDLFSLILQQPQKPRREMLHYIRGFTQPQIMPQQQNQPSPPQQHPQQQQHDNPQPPQQQNQP